jgi:Flp pilus assembly protein TadD
VTLAAHQPYIGLRHYEADDHHQFFGRKPESAAVLEQWSASALTILYGPPGVGKTSLINAAVVPMAQAMAGPDRIVLPPGQVTNAATAPPAHGNPLARSVVRSWSATGARVTPASVSAFLNRLRPTGQLYRPRIFAVIDQLEQVFRDATAAPYRQPFLNQLADAVRDVPGLHLLVSIREDVLHELAALEAAATGTRRWHLGALAPDAALEAVTGPVRGHLRSYAAGAAEELVRNLRTSQVVDVLGDSREVLSEGVEPVQLQAACSALWHTLPSGVEAVTKERLYSPGDLDGGLVRFCERVVCEVAAAHHIPERDLWTWLATTFVTDLGGRDTAYEGRSGVANMPRDVAGHLVDRYLLTTERRFGASWYQLHNDRLLAPVREAAGRQSARTPGPPITPSTSLDSAQEALAKGDYARAAQRATEAVRTSGTDLYAKARALACLGHIETATGEDQAAESHFREAANCFELLGDPSGAGRSLAGIGRSLLRRGRHVEAVAELQGAEIRVPSDPTIRVDLARALRDSGQLWAATAMLGAALTVAPETVEALVERGLIRIETGEFSSALDDLDNAVRMQPSFEQQEVVRRARAVARAHLGLTA